MRSFVRATVIFSLGLPVLMPAASAQTKIAPCHITGQGGPQIAVSVGSDKSIAKVGDAIAVEWKIKAPLDPACRTPLFLVFAMPKAVRFAGEGFLALPPNSEGPYRITFGRDRMRVFVPLHVGAPVAAGALKIKVYAAGPFDLSWSVVEIPKLTGSNKGFAVGRELVAPASQGTAKLDVGLGRPSVVFLDVFSTEKPKRIVLHHTAGYELHDFGTYFRVLEHATGLLVAEQRGTDAAFSNSGRFVYYFGVPVGVEHAYQGSGIAGDVTHLEAIDLLTGEQAIRIRPETEAGEERSASDRGDAIHSVSWVKDDAFLAVAIGNHVDRQVAVFQPLIDGRSLHKTCIVCNLEISLEEALVHFPPNVVDGQRYVVDFPYSTLLFGDPRGRASTVVPMAFATSQFEALPDDDRAMWSLDDKTQKAVMKALLASHRLGDRASSIKVPLNDKPGYAKGGRIVQEGDLRPTRTSISENEAGRRLREAMPRADLAFLDANPRIEERLHLVLEDYGLSASRPVVAEKMVPERAVERIRQEVPRAGQLFDAADYSNCYAFRGGDSWVYRDEFEPGSVDANDVSQAQLIRLSDKQIWLVATHCEAGTGRFGVGRLFLLTALPDGTSTIHWLHSKAVDGREVGDVLGLNEGRTIVATVSRGRYLTIATEGRSGFVVWDLAASGHSRVFKSGMADDVINRILMTDDERHVIQINSDGGLRIYSGTEGKQVVSGRFIDDEVIFYDHRGYYGGTAEGAHHLQLKFPGVPGLHSFHQYRATLNRPDLILPLFKGEQVVAADPLLPIPPTVDLQIKSDDVFTAKRSLRLQIKATAEKGLASLRLFVDGQLKAQVALSGETHADAHTLTVPVTSRWITAQAIDRSGYESAPITAPLKDSGARAGRRLVALAVGTDTYSDPRLPNLDFARQDAQTFLKAVRSVESLYYKTVTGEALLDAKNLGPVLLQKLEELVGTVQADDTVALFIAGHGVRDDVGRFYLTTGETRMADLATTAIRFDAIAAALQSIRGRVVIFLDACHSGAAGGLASNDDVAAAFLDRTSAIAVIAASKGRQFSHERADISGGVFTRALEQALVADRARVDANGNGVIELSELYGALKRQVVETTGGEQTPWIARNNMVGEIPLF